jgi:hypothetical protein
MFRNLFVALEKFSFKKSYEVQGKKKYRVGISNGVAALENLDTEVDINGAWETIRENIKMSAKESFVIMN